MYSREMGIHKPVNVRIRPEPLNPMDWRGTRGKL